MVDARNIYRKVTRKIYDFTPEQLANLTAIVDSNPRYQGKNVNGVPIWKPDAIRGTNASILISSRVSQQSIHGQIKDGLHLDNDVVTLYQLD